MNNISFNCPECGSMVEVPVQYAGQQITCPHCAEEIIIPEMTATEAAFAPLPEAAKNPSPIVKKVLALIGVIIFVVIAIISGFVSWEWYQTQYLPEKNKLEWKEFTSRVDALATPDEKIAMLKKYLTDNPQKKRSEIERRIQNLEKEKQQELLRQQQEKQKQEELKHQEELKRQRELKRQQELEARREAEQTISQNYQQALNQDRSEHIFIVRNSGDLPPAKFCLFKYDSTLMTQMAECQRLKKELVSYFQTLKSLIKIYYEKPESPSIPYLKPIKENADEANKKLPALISELAGNGAGLIVDADIVFHNINTVFVNIPAGEWLLVGVSEAGEIFFCNIVKRKQLPIFIEFKADGLQDISSSRYNDQERELEKKFQVVPAKTDRPAQTAAAI